MATASKKGSPDSPVVIVGESLGRQRSRIPFDGGSGRLLNRALEEAGTTKDAVFTTNVVDWHPLNSYQLTQRDISNETPRLKRELDAVSPKLVICLGKVAETTLRTLYPDARIFRWRSRRRASRSTTARPSYSPCIRPPPYGSETSCRKKNANVTNAGTSPAWHVLFDGVSRTTPTRAPGLWAAANPVAEQTRAQRTRVLAPAHTRPAPASWKRTRA